MLPRREANQAEAMLSPITFCVMGLFFASAKVYLQNISLFWRTRMDMRYIKNYGLHVMSAQTAKNALAAIVPDH
jgi:hypothetical protein